jgi:hypothetical protein
MIPEEGQEIVLWGWAGSFCCLVEGVEDGVLYTSVGDFNLDTVIRWRPMADGDWQNMKEAVR